MSKHDQLCIQNEEFCTENDEFAVAYPVRELSALRKAVLGSTDGKYVTIPSAQKKSLVASGATAADMELVFAAEQLDVTVTALGVDVSLTVAPGGVNATLSIAGQACRGTFPLPAGLKEISLRLLVDGVSLEAFVAGGRGVCSFATDVNNGSPPAQSAGIVAAAGKSPVTLLNATVWQMGSDHEHGQMGSDHEHGQMGSDHGSRTDGPHHGHGQRVIVSREGSFAASEK